MQTAKQQLRNYLDSAWHSHQVILSKRLQRKHGKQLWCSYRDLTATEKNHLVYGLVVGNSNNGEINSGNMVRGFVQMYIASLQQKWPQSPDVQGKHGNIQMNWYTWAVVNSSFELEPANDAWTILRRK